MLTALSTSSLLATLAIPPAADPVGWQWSAFFFLRTLGALVLLYMTLFGDDFGLAGKFSMTKASIRWIAFFLALGLTSWAFLDASGASFLKLLASLWKLIFGTDLPIPVA